MLSQTNQTLNPFFHPQGIVIIGVSQNPAKLGYGIAQNLVQSGYQGAIHFVNPKGGELFERTIYCTIEDVPDPVDLAVLLIPAQLVPATLTACGQRGIRAAIIASGGFREVGAAGAALEAECLRVAHKYDMRLMGPNCIGLIDTHLPLDTTFLPPPGPPTGDIAFISHSGAICAAIIDWARGQGFGFSRIVSLGNQVDVTETDVLPPVAADAHTRVLTLYLEGVGNGRAFIHAAQQVTPHKPVVALKAGRSAAGQRAAASHTGALAGQENAYDAAFRRAGVLRASDANEMFNWARALAWQPLPQGPNVAVLTNAGGPGVLAADALEAQGLKLAALTPASVAALQAQLSAAASVQNPVDMLATASPEQYAVSLDILLADPNVDAVMVVVPAPPMFTAGGVARAIIPGIQTADKPVVIALMGSTLIQEATAYFRAAHIPEYRFPAAAASALGVLWRRAAFLGQETAVPILPAQVDKSKLEALLAAQPPGFLPQSVLQELLAAYGIPALAMILASSPAQAVLAADALGYPAALKIASPDIPHKSDVGGVLLNVEDGAAVSAGFTTLVERAKKARPAAQILGVEVQQMALEGQEVVVGVVQDPQFGPLVMFGSGGVEVEGLGDVAFALAPLTPTDAQYLLDKTWAGRKLRGFRHIERVDETAVADVLIRIAQLAADFPQIAEIEINPLRACADGAIALDVRARLA